MNEINIFIDDFIKKHPWQEVIVDKRCYKYLVGGHGKRVFLIFPGSGQDAMSCFDLIHAFEFKYKVIALQYDSINSIDEFFLYAQAVISQEKAESVVLYGLSLGGFLAQHFVRKWPAFIEKLIISHAGSTRSKTVRRRVAMPAIILFPLIRVIPQKVLTMAVRRIANILQAGKSDPKIMYEQFSDVRDYYVRVGFAKKSNFSLANKKYLRSLYYLGKDLEKKEKNFKASDMSGWNGEILILRTDNDPLAQDDGMFSEYYPKAEVITFTKTGHLTPFIRSKEIVRAIKKWLDSG